MSQPLFGVVVPGRPVMTNFMPVDATKCIAELACPTDVSEVTFFMLPTTPIPPGCGAVLYYSPPPFTGWELLGSVSPDKQSGTFRTGWTTKEDMKGCPMVQLGVSVESLETINNLSIATSGVEDRREFAFKIARDLFEYMASFSQSGSQSGAMLVPNNIFDQWIQRFDRKYRLDPNFMMKSR
ncbi:unnamed protein product [Ectocarpus fasciculatus]